MPKFKQPIDLHRDRYLDPHYSVHFEDEELHYREHLSRSKFWSWVTWVRDGIFYWNVMKDYNEDSLASAAREEREMQTMWDQILAERKLKKELDKKSEVVRNNITKWRALNKDAVKQNQYLRGKLKTINTALKNVKTSMRFQNTASKQPQNYSDYSGTGTSSFVSTTNSEFLSEADSQCFLQVHPDSGHGIQDFGSPNALAESSISMIADDQWAYEPGEILSTMTPTIQDFIQEVNESKPERPREVRIEIPKIPEATRSSIESIFEFENDRKAGGRPEKSLSTADVDLPDAEGTSVLESLSSYSQSDSNEGSGLDTNASSYETLPSDVLADSHESFEASLPVTHSQFSSLRSGEDSAIDQKMKIHFFPEDYEGSIHEIPSSQLSYVTCTGPNAGMHQASELSRTRPPSPQNNQRQDSIESSSIKQPQHIFPEDSVGSIHVIPSSQLSYVEFTEHTPGESPAARQNSSSGLYELPEDTNANEVPALPASLAVLDTVGCEFDDPAFQNLLKEQVIAQQMTPETNANVNILDSTAMDNAGRQGFQNRPGYVQRVNTSTNDDPSSTNVSNQSSFDTIPSFPSVPSLILLDDWGFEIKQQKPADAGHQNLTLRKVGTESCTNQNNQLKPKSNFSSECKKESAKKYNLATTPNVEKSEESSDTETDISGDQSGNSVESGAEKEYKRAFVQGWIQDYNRNRKS